MPSSSMVVRRTLSVVVFLLLAFSSHPLPTFSARLSFSPIPHQTASHPHCHFLSVPSLKCQLQQAWLLSYCCLLYSLILMPYKVGCGEEDQTRRLNTIFKTTKEQNVTRVPLYDFWRSADSVYFVCTVLVSVVCSVFDTFFSLSFLSQLLSLFCFKLVFAFLEISRKYDLPVIVSYSTNLSSLLLLPRTARHCP
jgi:hypothetical protein